MLNVGYFLQNRYEIIGRIGSGGMADVYRARDHKLNRFVAVKVLKPEFRGDKNFVSKFRVEAQSAAGLAHPNIVNVYDVGEENGAYFIVMELVEGITLKEYIRKKGVLSMREMTSIALQVAAGLEAAHNNGVIHRDVKPQNIIISVDGHAKVADFGIARAASSNTINSNVMGSVHYSAPEQTRGGYSDAKSDIYSMGVTMYEMVTGRVPFDGENTVEVALHHLQDEIVPPRLLVPNIPHSTEAIILKCTQKSPDRRYANMAELIRDLKESLVNPEGDFVRIVTMDNSAQTIQLTREELERINKAAGPMDSSGPRAPKYPVYEGNGATDLFNQDYRDPSYQDPRGDYRGDYQGEYDPRTEESEDYEEYDPDELDEQYERERRDRKLRQQKSRKKHLFSDENSSRMDHLITALCIAAAVIVAIAFLILIAHMLGIFKSGSNSESGENKTQVSTENATENLVEVPNLIGKTEAEAQTALHDLGLGYKYQGESPSSDYPKGQVISLSVESGSMVERNTTIGYVLSAGSTETLTVPSLTNVAWEEAESALTSMGLNVTIDNTRYSDSVESGYVITTNPGYGSDVKAGDTVTLYVSQGKENAMVTVPDVTGHYVEDAKTALNNLGLYVYITETSSPTVDKNLVISQDVAPYSSVQSGTTVTITVSTGPSEVEIIDNADGTWMCCAQLSEPAEYDGEPVRITLDQNGTVTTIFEGTTTFPYLLNVEGQPGVAMGTAYVYTLDPDTWEVASTTVYEGITFEQVG